MPTKPTPYDKIADKYDTLFASRDEVQFLKMLVALYGSPKGRLLELGCGTGTLLKHFYKSHTVCGIDNSSAMLSLAKKAMPKGNFLKSDMSDFKFDEKFDLILCLFNSINHLSEFKHWRSLFKQSLKHLNKNGVLIFDILTEKGLENCALVPVHAERSSKEIMFTEYSLPKKNTLKIQISIFSKIKKNTHKLNETIIIEKTYSTKQILNLLSKSFSQVAVIDPDKNKPDKNSSVLYFICKA